MDHAQRRAKILFVAVTLGEFDKTIFARVELRLLFHPFGYLLCTGAGKKFFDVLRRKNIVRVAVMAVHADLPLLFERVHKFFFAHGEKNSLYIISAAITLVFGF